jgi:hypothetical protein
MYQVSCVLLVTMMHGQKTLKCFGFYWNQQDQEVDQEIDEKMN